MKRIMCYLSGVILALIVSSSHAQLRLSFNAMAGSYDETTDSTLALSLPALEHEGEYFLWFTSVSHHNTGYPSLLDTDAGGTPSDFIIIAWLEPGEVFVGWQYPVEEGGNGTLFLRGTTWEGRHPTEFAHFRVVLLGQTGHWGDTCILNTYSIPIVWLTEPVATDNTSWSQIKALYRK